MPRYRPQCIIMSGILVYTEDDLGNIYFVLGKDSLTQKMVEGQTKYTFLDHQLDISDLSPCDMGDSYEIYLHRMSYEQCKKLSKQEGMRLVSYKEHYELETTSRDFRNKLIIALTEATFS